MKQNQKGFGVLETFLVIIVVAILVFISWRFLHSSKKIVDDKPVVATKSITPPTATAKGTKKEFQLPANWIWYENKELNSKLAYPKDWSIATNKPETCSFNSPLYGSDSCPLTVILSPKEYADDTRVSIKNEGLLEITWFAGQKIIPTKEAYNSEIANYQQQKADTALSQELTINDQSGFYIHATTSSWNDNVWAINATNHYIRFFNRELNQVYNGTDGSVADTIDYTKFTPTIKQIVESTSKLQD